MKTKKIIILVIVFAFYSNVQSQVADRTTYLSPIISEFQKGWPNNKTMNLVFHGHSVPTGYFATPNVHTLQAYPYLTLANLKGTFNKAVINTITTSIGGEDSEQGELRFGSEVLTMRPDVVFIDYAINDRRLSLARSEAAWTKMIQDALASGCKVMLMTPTPITSENLLDEQSPLAVLAAQIRDLAALHHVGLVDSFKAFQDLANAGVDLSSYFAHQYHVNEKGHAVVVQEIRKWFDLAPLSNKSFNDNKTIQYYPNPIKKNEKLKIDLSAFNTSEPINFSVTTIDGKTIFSKVISIFEQKDFSYKISQQGILLLTLSNEKEKQTFKVIVN
ncbi:SGNH/GDSL hydrolase family protein [Wocania ichthyoenteri]|uniref:SGNH/GDSL hydrolase family protein n=1 Tax=Wocania ichthyoenteri TaxID=1230531 RepID=UPI0009DD43E7|nr:SGNH/GDSL hydrolase family protein [Wocania ichthyoenteri]